MIPHRPRVLGAGVLAGLLAAPAVAAPPVSRNVTLLAQKNDFSATGLYSACWGYVHSDGREYAVIGHQEGTAIYNITNPAAPYLVNGGYIPGASSIWREMKQYRDWIYISTEAVSGLQIVRMTDPENPVLVATYNLTYNQEHTVTVDTARALLYANGTRLDGASPNDRGMRILSLASPESPVEVSFYNPDPVNFADDWYVHDSHVAGTRVYLSCIYGGYVRVLDAAVPANPIEIASWTYPGAFTHNTWTTADEKHLFATDEVTNEPLKVFDISNLATPQLVGQWIGNPTSIVHNVHVKGDTAFCSNYTEGVRLLDITDPTTPAEFGFYDTFQALPSGVFDGCWEVAPYYPSGVMIASDRQYGLFVLRSNPVYGSIKVKVRDAASPSTPVVGATVRLLGAGDSLSTPFHGNVRFGPSPGSETVRVSRFGYATVDVPITVTAGVYDSITVLLSLVPTSGLSGTVRAAADASPLQYAEAALAYTPYQDVTDAAGFYDFGPVIQGLHRMTVARPGFAFAELWRHVPGNSLETLDAALVRAAFYDSCDTNKGWSLSAPGDNAVSGQWLRADPVGVFFGAQLAEEARRAAGGAEAERAAAGAASPEPCDEGAGASAAGLSHPEPCEGTVATTSQPEDDHTFPPGTFCFVTGNGPPGGGAGVADVDGGKTTLTTPALDLSGMSDPRVSFWRWFFTNVGAPDHFVVDVSPDNGGSWFNVESLTVSRERWEPVEIRVGDYITPTATVKVRFAVADLGAGNIVEGLVDDFAAYDAAATPVGVRLAVPAALALSTAAPNPATGEQHLTLSLPRGGRVRVVVHDVAGRAVRTLAAGFAGPGAVALAWDGRDDRGRTVEAGLYWVRARTEAGEVARKVVRGR